MSEEYAPKHRREPDSVPPEPQMCLACDKRPANDRFSGNSLLCGVCYYDL